MLLVYMSPFALAFVGGLLLVASGVRGLSRGRITATLLRGVDAKTYQGKAAMLISWTFIVAGLILCATYIGSRKQ
jgi:hypothetical protein